MPPKEGSKRYKTIVNRGCGGYSTETTDGTDYDCEHRYDWTCDDCPCCIEKYRNPEPVSVVVLDFDFNFK